MSKSKLLLIVRYGCPVFIFSLISLFCFFGCAENPARTSNSAAMTKRQSTSLSFTNDPLFKSDDNSKEIWDSLQQSFLALDAPRSWRTNRPSAKVLDDWKTHKAQMALQMADQSRDYYLRFPNAPQATLARESEYNLLEIVVNSGNTKLLPRLTALDNQKLSNSSLNSDQRFALKAHIVERNANLHLDEGVPVVMAQLEAGSRELLKEFPDNPQAWKFLVTVADQEQDPKKARELVQEILAGNADESLKMQTRRILGRLNHIGNPIAFQGTGLDGQPIDLDQMKGKVVLFHFWDTDCGYCIEKLPEIKTVYEKFHGQGLEIVSVSFDHNKDRLVQFLAKNPMPWPQYFAGPGWNATYGNIFDVQAMPAIWLVDKRGNLRDINARENLASKVEKMLNED